MRGITLGSRKMCCLPTVLSTEADAREIFNKYLLNRIENILKVTLDFLPF